MLERGQTERHIDRQTDRQTDRLFGREFILAVQLTFVSPAKMAKPIDMPYRGLIPVGPRKNVLHGGRDPLRVGAIFGVVQPTETHRELFLLQYTPQKGSESYSDFISVVARRLKITAFEITNKINRCTDTM